jgi:hypothetical protein
MSVRASDVLPKFGIKSAKVIAKAVECTHLGGIPRNREVTYSLHFIWVNFFPVFRDDMSQECNTVDAEGAFRGI